MQGMSVLGLVAAKQFYYTVETAPLPEPPLFQTVFIPRHNFFGCGLLLSTIFHCLLFFGLPPLLALLPESDAVVIERRMRAMRALEIRIPERLYLPAALVDPPKAAAARPKPKEAPAPMELTKNQLQEPNVPKAITTPRIAPQKFKLPEKVRRVNDDQTLIQSHLPPELALEARVKLPQLVLTSALVLPRPAPRRFVEPGKTAAAAVVPRMDAPPQLAMSSDLNPDLRIASMLAGPEQAVLRLPRPTEPVKPFQAPAPIPSGRGASVSPALGEPISVLALSLDPAALQERVVIPVGNQIGRLPDLPAPPPTAEAAAGASGQGGLGDLARALAALPVRYATPIRVEHPVNATFDIVVQSASDQAVPESVGALSGQPIYTVYLNVGAPKAWLLQYCVPRDVSGAVKIVAGAVNIGSPTPIKAPFPLVTVLPPATMVPRTGYIIVHALLDASGQLKEPSILRAPNASFKGPILAELLKWQFRPAVRNGGPVAVEILLAIPPQQL
jgi:hypothetical protein